MTRSTLPEGSPRWLLPPAQLALRAALAVPFLRSGLTKWEGVGQLSDTTTYLFREEFRLHLFGQLVPYPAPTLMAWASGCAEILLPTLLLLGLGTRWAALGLLGMTAIIQLTVPDGWANFHLPWAAMSLALVALGGGPWSVGGWWQGCMARRARDCRSDARSPTITG